MCLLWPKILHTEQEVWGYLFQAEIFFHINWNENKYFQYFHRTVSHQLFFLSSFFWGRRLENRYHVPDVHNNQSRNVINTQIAERIWWLNSLIRRCRLKAEWLFRGNKPFMHEDFNNIYIFKNRFFCPDALWLNISSPDW